MVAESKSLPERVAGIYYSHGVLCAAHPIPVIIVAIITVLLTCIPLANLPLPSNIPQTFVERANSSSSDAPRWLLDPPIFVQQVIMKSAVSPWTEDMILTDAIRAPLAEVFRLIEAIQNYQHPSGITLLDVCTRVEAPLRPLPLPQYNCLIVSPANFWHQDPNQFFDDVSLVTTVYNQGSVQVGKSSLSELLFGVNLKEAGFKRYPLRSRQRILQYAVTIFYNVYNKEFVDGMNRHLANLYPVHNDNSTRDIIHIYHPGDFDFHEFLPLFFTYTILFFYMYFSVRKIELVKNKVGIALSAVFTVMASLVMSIGLCLFFGLDPAGSSRGREVFPYLVVVVGLENILVLTKSIVSTQAHLDAKIRVAQGLSKEGWGITKNLLAELTILTIGLFTLVPSIQEFCIFAMVGLLCDFFLQMCFFSTVLSLDMRGMEEASDGMMPRLRDYVTPQQHRSITRTRSVPRIDCRADENDRVPKRLRLMLFWGRTRIVQRAFMLVMVAWIGGFVYSAGILQHLVPSSPENGMRSVPAQQIPHKYKSPLGKEGEQAILEKSHLKLHPDNFDNQVLQNYGDAAVLPLVKWCYLTTVYNSSSACRLASLPPVRLGCLIPPVRATALRNSREPLMKPFKWHSLAQALDPTEDVDAGSQARDFETPFLPTSPLEVLLVTALCVISILVMSYASLALYHCICSRNYAQWRSAWTNNQANQPDTTAQVVLQAVPLVLEGQGQCVEWLTSDGSTVACSYLSGDVNVWDISSGERLSHINRKSYFSPKNELENLSSEGSSPRCEYKSHSPTPLQEQRARRRFTSDQEVPRRLPDLSKAINFNFTKNSGQRVPQDYSEQGFDYGPTVRLLYEQETDLEWEEENEEGLFENCPNIWSMSSADNLIVLGTSSGRLEFWEATTGKLKGIFDDNCNIGVTCLKMVSTRCVVARLNGGLELFTIDWCSVPNQTYRRAGGHIRAQSSGGLEAYGFESLPGSGELMIHRSRSVRAHQQPITVLEVEAGRILTGSRDHTLKVFSLHDEFLVFTLHAHCGPITSLFIDSINPMTAGSGSQDGMVCVWDLLTGACVYSLDAHDGPVTAMTYSSSYVLSLGFDEKLCVWDRFQGHLLNTVQLTQAYCTSMAMLTHNLLITSKQGSLVIWDVRTGEPVRLVKLGHTDPYVYVNTILPLRDSVACDYGHSLRIVRFPLVRDKTD
ncbi:sterol regulatory element-binding protein cleavage-activating protein isoform X1 [Cimex lectularius]|uniref:Sterol regulatory element-binding protein cleavage-activating protein n=1 Tax=Cimex lectularius TaxID=79782 RepID=A0A8I6S896_CIMLE|nr:sterol regulatory element-binding protein cleavage-activating protein isoform X1 [Cimex lectularius]